MPFKAGLGYTYTGITEEQQKKFAAKLRAFRKKHGLSQAQLAAAMGADKWTVLKLENGYERPWESTIIKFLKLEAKFERAEAKEVEALEGLS